MDVLFNFVKTLVSNGLNLAILVTVVIQILLFRERHRNRLKDIALDHLNFWVRDRIVENLEDLQKALRVRNADLSHKLIGEIIGNVSSWLQTYAIIRRKYYNEITALNNILADIESELLTLTTRSLPRKDKNEKYSKISESFSSMNGAIKALISEISEEIQTTDLTIYGKFWGKNISLKNAIPK